MTELLLTEIEIRDAMNKPFPSNESPWSLVDVSKSDKEIAKAQATKAVEMILSRIKELEVHDSYSYRLVGYRISVEELNAFESELLDEIREGK